MKIEKYVTATLYKTREIDEKYTRYQLDHSFKIGEDVLFGKVENKDLYINLQQASNPEQAFEIKLKATIGKSHDKAVVFSREAKLHNGSYFITNIKILEPNEASQNQVELIANFENVMGLKKTTPDFAR